MLQTDRVENVDEKNGVKWGHLSSFHIFLLSYNP